MIRCPYNSFLFFEWCLIDFVGGILICRTPVCKYALTGVRSIPAGNCMRDGRGFQCAGGRCGCGDVDGLLWKVIHFSPYQTIPIHTMSFQTIPSLQMFSNSLALLCIFALSNKGWWYAEHTGNTSFARGYAVPARLKASAAISSADESLFPSFTHWLQ